MTHVKFFLYSRSDITNSNSLLLSPSTKHFNYPELVAVATAVNSLFVYKTSESYSDKIPNHVSSPRSKRKDTPVPAASPLNNHHSSSCSSKNKSNDL